MMERYSKDEMVSYVKAIKMIMKILSTGYINYHLPDEES